MMDKIEKLKKTGTVILLSGALAFTIGCDKKDDVITINKTPDTMTIVDEDNKPDNSDNVIITEVHPDTERSFAKGEHLVNEYHELDNHKMSEDLEINAISIKNGYQLVDVVSRCINGVTSGYFCFYVNDEDVMVKGKWNKETQEYEYNSFGEVIPTFEEEKGFSK